MTTADATAWLRSRIRQASTITELRNVWSNMGIDYQRLPEIIAAKNNRKKELRK